MAASFNKYLPWVGYLAGLTAAVSWKQTGGDAIMCALSDTAQTNVTEKYTTGNITEIATGNGYTQGGTTCTCGNMTISAGTVSYPLTVASPTWTSSTGDMGQFQFVIFYDNTATNKPVIGWYDYGSHLVLKGANGDTFTVSLTGGNLFSLS